METLELGFPDQETRELWMDLFIQASAHTQVYSDGNITPALEAPKANNPKAEVKKEEYPHRPAEAKPFKEISLDPSLHLSDELKQVPKLLADFDRSQNQIYFSLRLTHFCRPTQLTLSHGAETNQASSAWATRPPC